MSQETRKITYASTRKPGANNVFSNASTWGELKNGQPELAAESMGMKVWIKGEGPNQGTNIVSDTQTLPSGDFQLYFLVDKNDSGI